MLHLPSPPNKPILRFFFCIVSSDSTSPANDILVGNAKIAGLADDLHLHGLQYNIALTVFFVPYALFEVPSNIVLKIIRPSIWISILMFCWGLVMTLMGVIQNTKGLYAARFFLGFTEVCALPLLSSFYFHNHISNT